MPRVNFNGITAIDESTTQRRLPAGNYICTITKFEDVPEKHYAWLYVDIAEGEYAGYFSRDFYDDKGFAHRLNISYDQTGDPQKVRNRLGLLKGRLQAITDSNPGFDAEAAFNADNPWGQFSGRKVGVVFQDEEYNGKINAKPNKLFPISKLADMPEPTHIEQPASTSKKVTSTFKVDDDISQIEAPF